jgi:hypothetical protein
MYHNGTKWGEHVLATAPVVAGALRIGSSEPSGNDPMSLLLRQVYHWDHAISEKDAGLFSGNLAFVPETPMVKPIVSLPTALNVREGSVVQVPVSRTGTAACQVNIRTKQNTALVTTDYIGIGPVAVNFLVGETQKLVDIQTVADTIEESLDPSENFSVVLELISGNTSCELGNAACTVSIHDTPRVQIATAVNATEGQSAVISVAKIGFGSCSVTYRTVGDTALNTQDYTGIGATTLSFSDTETTKTVSIPVLQDNATDSGEKFKVVLENPVGCKLGNATCTVTIYDVGVEPLPVGSLYTPPTVFAQFTGSGTTANVDFGIGQTPYYVTSLADTNTEGTLRHAVGASNRLILFEVGGCIKIPQSGLNMTNLANVTIAGETAPSPGIIIQGGEVYMSRSNKFNVRHITFERGYDTRQEAFETTNPVTKAYNSNGDAIIVQGNGVTKNLWIDHCATFWSNDEAIQIWRDVNELSNPSSIVVENVSITNTIIAEPLYAPEKLTNPDTGKFYKGHWQGGIPEYEHNYGTIIGDGVQRVDMQYCLQTDAFWRSPIIGGGSTIVLANLVSLNGQLGAHHGGAAWAGATKITCVGYLKITGQNSSWRKTPGIKLHGAGGTSYHADTRVWYSNLYADRGKSTYPLPETVIWGRADSATLSTTEAKLVLKETDARPIDIPTAPVEALSQEDLYNRTLLNCGPRPKDRDAKGNHVQSHIQRQYDKLTLKDGKWVNHQSEVGGFSSFTKATRSLRDGTGKFKDGTVIPAFPTETDKAAVRKWLRRFLDDVQYD